MVMNTEIVGKLFKGFIKFVMSLNKPELMKGFERLVAMNDAELLEFIRSALPTAKHAEIEQVLESFVNVTLIRYGCQKSDFTPEQLAKFKKYFQAMIELV